MASRTLLATGVVAIALMVWFAGGTHSRQPALRDEHSRPAVRVPSQVVAVTAQGKTFHDPKCTYIHGPAETMPAAAAVQKGYAPCPRCMKAALGE